MRFNAMRSNGTRVVVALCGLALSASPAQTQVQKAQNSDAIAHAHPQKAKRRSSQVVLSPDDGLSVIATALDAYSQTTREPDCSHLVHAVYLRAGFPYPYASSTDLYDGAGDFQRMKRPQPGDLVVWPGHVGIVVNPGQHLFFSRLGRGPGVEAYDAQYWKERGQVRFYRYVKSGAAATHLVASQRHK